MMKERLKDMVLIWAIGLWLMLAIVFVYQDLQKEIAKSNNDIFIDDRAYYQENISEIQSKLDTINRNVAIIAEQLEIDIIEITKK